MAKMSLHDMYTLAERMKHWLVSNPDQDAAPRWKIICAEDEDRARIEAGWPGADTEVEFLEHTAERTTLFDLGTDHGSGSESDGE
jgi:hypothetical protein